MNILIAPPRAAPLRPLPFHFFKKQINNTIASLSGSGKALHGLNCFWQHTSQAILRLSWLASLAQFSLVYLSFFGIFPWRERKQTIYGATPVSLLMHASAYESHPTTLFSICGIIVRLYEMITNWEQRAKHLGTWSFV